MDAHVNCRLGGRVPLQHLHTSRLQCVCSTSGSGGTSGGSTSSNAWHSDTARSIQVQHLSTGCNLQRRPNPPRRLKNADRDLASINGATVVSYNAGNGSPLISAEGAEALKYSVTEFVAETLLPTRSGKFRLRGYRHSVGVFPTHVTCIVAPWPFGCRGTGTAHC
jgi:hypothetical protein